MNPDPYLRARESDPFWLDRPKETPQDRSAQDSPVQTETAETAEETRS